MWAMAIGAGIAQAQAPSCADLRAQKGKVYGFHLTQLNETQIDAKSKEIDTYWKQLQSAGPEGVSCLKEMLAAEKTDHIFQFDAASFLFQLDKSPESLNLVKDAIVQTDFQETDPANYLSLALEIGQRGVTIQSLAATHLLAEEMTEEAFRTLSTWGGLAEIKEDYRRNDTQAVMKYQAPDPADFANPKWTREQVLQIIAGLPHTRKEFDDVMSTRGAEFDRQMREKKPSQEELAKAVAESEPIYGISDRTSFQNSAVATLKAEDFDTLREARRKALYNISDESLSEYLAYTQVMIRLLNRLDLYKDYRAQ